MITTVAGLVLPYEPERIYSFPSRLQHVIDNGQSNLYMGIETTNGNESVSLGLGEVAYLEWTGTIWAMTDKGVYIRT